jgi:hypothetical protein
LIYTGTVAGLGVKAGLIGALVVLDGSYDDKVSMEIVTASFNTSLVPITSTLSITPSSVSGAGPNQVSVPYTLSFKLVLGVPDETGRVEV